MPISFGKSELYITCSELLQHFLMLSLYFKPFPDFLLFDANINAEREILMNEIKMNRREQNCNARSIYESINNIGIGKPVLGTCCLTSLLCTVYVQISFSLLF